MKSYSDSFHFNYINYLLKSERRKIINKFIKKTFIIFAIVLSTLFVAGCCYYGVILFVHRNHEGVCHYIHHFYVDGGHGELIVEEKFANFVRSCEEYPTNLGTCPSNCKHWGGFGAPGGYREATYTAIPDEGYIVKEWLYNGEIVEGNKTNLYTARVTSENEYNGVIVVRFKKNECI